MDRRLLIAVTLSIIVMLLYPMLLSRIMPVTPNRPGQETMPQPITQQEVMQKEVPVALHVPQEGKSLEGVNTAPLVNDFYEINLADRGGVIKDVKVRPYGDVPGAELVKDAIGLSGMMAIEGEGILKGLSSQPFVIRQGRMVFEKDDVAVAKELRFMKDKYGFTAKVSITNNGDKKEPMNFLITAASNITKKEVFESRYIEADLYLKDGKIKRFTGGKLKKYKELYSSDIEWICLKNKYYSIICKPRFAAKGVFINNIDGRPTIGFIIKDTALLPGETRSYEFIYYAGPTMVSELEKVDPYFTKMLNFGIFTSISMILLSVLKFFYAIFHNYGVSIFLLTICVGMLLFPLSFKSLQSMRKLQELQPKIEKIKTQHKDNPHKLNKEMMELYRRYNVNPMGGCLPMLLQMPIFIALYQTLMRSVELKGAGFLWIKDLSMPDAAFKLPFTLPLLGNAINILPILMIGAMILQQKMSQFKAQAAQTEQQKMMSNIMPLMFGVIFYNLPSGLVLYWLTNTLLTSTLQFMMLRKT